MQRDHVATDFGFQHIGGSFCDDPAVFDDGEPVAQRVGFVEVVGRDQHGGPPCSQPAHFVPQVRPALRVETSGRLSRKSNFGEWTRPSAMSTRRR